jgi:hypothetical protein
MTKPSGGKVSKSGHPRPQPKGGSRKGIPNKATANAREAIARFVDGNAERLQGWLDQIAETDGPKAAWQCFMDTLEFHVPKLARTELTGKDGDPMQVDSRVLIIEGIKPHE